MAKNNKLEVLMSHYSSGVQDMDIRRTRANGWNATINAYMSKLPSNWPYTAKTTDPVIRTTILEKTSRLLNAKLQGRLVPREGGDMVKAKINNAILNFQWDYANSGGSMLEKIAVADQTARLFGAAFGLVYWDNKKECNELKIIDNRDIFFDPACTHVNNARWVQVREYTTQEELEARGYKVKGLKELDRSDWRNSSYEDQVKINRGLEDKVGHDIGYKIYEVVTEWASKTKTVFLPRYGKILDDGKNPYQHGKIPIPMLRYYPLGDDIYGESEVESVIPLQRAINAVICGYIDEMNLTMRPPVLLPSSGVVMSTIEYGPGARWISNDPNLIRELTMGGGAIAAFNNTYPALKAAFNTAMGDQSLGISNVKGYQTDKTATEVASLEKQQNNRDQYNQLYLAEFLKSVMMMWLSNNKQYLFDDPSKEYKIIKIIGKSAIRDLQQVRLDGTDVPDEVVNEIADTTIMAPDVVDDALVATTMQEAASPVFPVSVNGETKSKLSLGEAGEAELYVTPEDMVGEYDYEPDVKSMAISSGVAMQNAREKAMEIVLNPAVQQMLQIQGESVNIKELLVGVLEDAGLKDSDGLFSQNQQVGPGANQPLLPPGGVQPVGSVAPNSQAIPYGPGPVGLSSAPEIQNL